MKESEAKEIKRLKKENAELKARLDRAHKNHEKLLGGHLLALEALPRRAAGVVGDTAGLVFEVVRQLTNDKDNVRFNRTLSSLNVPFDTLARRLNAQFFGGREKFGGSSFSSTTTVGDVVTMVEEG
jgi:hypothetical protein